MSDNVFILGAGASVESGAPLMKDFLDKAEDLLLADKFGSDSPEIKIVFNAINILQGVYSKSFLDLRNVESVFGAIEMAKIIRKLGDYSEEDIGKARNAIITLIVKTLEKQVRFSISNGQVSASPSYDKFVKLLLGRNEASNSIITFNYDVALDHALFFNDKKINYCLDEESGSGIKLLKLHGSINWGKCNECGSVIPCGMKKYIHKAPFLSSPIKKVAEMPFSGKLTNLLSCPDHGNKKIDPYSVIVPPTWNKTEYQGALTNVWHVAAEELSKARNIYVFGYSLPESDLFFRYLFALGTLGDVRLRRFWVFDPDPTGRLRKRYEKLIGPGIKDGFEYFQLSFSQAVDELRRRDKVASKEADCQILRIGS